MNKPIKMKIIKTIGVIITLNLIMLNNAYAISSSGGMTEKDKLLLGFGLVIFASLLSLITIKINQPVVLGQIIAGTLIGILAHYDIGIFPDLPKNHIFEFLAELGSIFLLFEIGLESNLSEIKKAGKHAVFVAITGAIIPFVLGYFIVTPLVAKNPTHSLALFMGSILAVTSTGISVSVFKSFGILKGKVGQIIIAASIIDDVIGLILLSITIELITIGHIDMSAMLPIFENIALFFLVSLLFGFTILSRIIRIIVKSTNSRKDLLILTLITYCIFMSYFASIMGLASIIGAFLAGLLVEEDFHHNYQGLYTKSESHLDLNFGMPEIAKSNHTPLVNLIEPIGKVLTPIFFIFAGLQVDIISSLNYQTIKLALIITFFGILGKSLCGIFLPRNINKWLIGFGMVPRGEIGIIFAITGLELKLIDQTMFAAILLMIIITSIITPITLNRIYNSTKTKSIQANKK